MKSFRLLGIIYFFLIIFFKSAVAMDDSENVVKYLKDYKNPDFQVDTINLTIDHTDEETIVTNEMTIRRTEWAEKSAPLILNGTKNLKLIELIIDNTPINKKQYQLSEEILTIKEVPEKFTLKVINKIYPQKNTSLEGFYLADDVYLTQCEPHGFRNIVYSIDRPDVMPVFTTKLIADKKYPVLLSNGDKIEEGNLEKDRHYAIWHDTSKKPTYLFAAVIGDLKVLKDKFKTMSGKTVNLEIYTANNDITKVDYAMYSLKAAMKWDEQVFAREYDLNTYMIVATPKFNSGAMENKGLNIFNSKLVLATKDTSTDDDHMNVYGVIGHEYFHNWTGNRITLRDWFQLSLKEGLTVFRDQEFSADSFSRPIFRIDDANLLRTVQFQEDASPLAHPVKPESYVRMDNFYTVTVYEKGAELIRMIQTLLGKEKFNKGMQLYFTRHDGQAVTTEDFVKSFEDANNVDLSQFKLWYSQAGTPLLKVIDNYDPKTQTYTLTIEQSCNPTPNQKTKKPFHLPFKLGLIGKNSKQELNFSYDNKNSKEVVLEITKTQHTFVLNDVKEQPIPSLLRDFSAPVKVNYSYKDEDLLFLFANDPNEFNKWDAAQKYSLKYLTKLTNDLIENKPLTVPTELISAFKAVLNNKDLDNAFIARAILLPNERIIQDAVTTIHPIEIYKTRLFLVTNIAKSLQTDFQNCYDKLNAKLSAKAYSLNNEDIAARLLKNICLSYLSHADQDLGINLAARQLKEADNLTDRLAALRILIDSEDDKFYELAATKFYEDWKDEELVVYHWLTLQSSSKRKDTLNKFAELVKHPAFDLKTPNKVYSVVRGLVNNTPIYHDKSGKGYKAMSDIIIKLDKLNPKTTARLVTLFNNWKKFDTFRQKLIKTELLKIKNQPDLSLDTKEIIGKILK